MSITEEQARDVYRERCCSNCRYWKVRSGEFVGSCQAITVRGVTGARPPHPAVIMPAEPLALTTRGDFACNEFEGKGKR